MAQSTRERLLEAAYELFSKHGFHAIGLDAILAEVGVTKTTFYNHFESKDDLVVAVIHDRDIQELHALLDAVRARAGFSPRAQLEELFSVLDEYYRAPDFRGCLFTSAAAEYPDQADPVHQAAAAHMESARRVFSDLAASAGAADPVACGDQIALIFQGSVIMRVVNGELRAAQIAREALRGVLERHLPAHGPASLTPPSVDPASVAAAGA